MALLGVLYIVLALILINGRRLPDGQYTPLPLHLSLFRLVLVLSRVLRSGRSSYRCLSARRSSASDIPSPFPPKQTRPPQGLSQAARSSPVDPAPGRPDDDGRSAADGRGLPDGVRSNRLPRASQSGQGTLWLVVVAGAAPGGWLRP